MKKPDKIETIIIIALSLLVLITIVLKIQYNYTLKTNRPPIIYITSTKVEKLPENVRELSKKYKAYQDLYKSDDLTLVYDYTTYNNPLGRDKEFHETLSKKLKKENINIKTIIYENWQDDTVEITLRNKQYIDDTATCGPGGKEEVELKNFVDLSQYCINNACLVDVKNHQITIMSADPDFIIETIKNYDPNKKPEEK